MNGVGMFLFEVSDFTSDFWVLPTLTMYNVTSAYDASWRASLNSPNAGESSGEKDFHIHAFRVNHNVPCYGYAFSLDRAGRFDAARAQQQQIPLKFWSRLQKGETIETEEGTLYTPDMVLGPPRKGLKLTYTTDTRPCESIVRYAQGADLMICEGMYGEPDKAEKAREHKHMTFTEAALLAKKAGPAELWLTHYSPSLIHPEDYMDSVRRIFPASRAAKDGRTVTLAFENETK